MLMYVIYYFLLFIGISNITSNTSVPLPMPENDTDILIEYDFPLTGTHRFSALTSFLLVYMDLYDRKQNNNAWEMDLYAIAEITRFRISLVY